ncbi:MAG: homogentisate 1,2-dioxygenase [Actinomycetota bacterium]|jgi:homogentisate 1,2-dioxygenase|nr:homogentisate 1,2-dioxygenase [Actinomycetota bacterium]
MPNYRSLGDVPPKRHLRVANPDGGLLFEELMGEEGFSGDSSLLYHRRSPSAMVDAKAVVASGSADGLVANQPLVPHHLRTGLLAVGGDPVTGRQVLLANDDVVLSWVAADAGGPLYRNAMGDELFYVQSGSAVLESVFGRMAVGPGDYVVVPASTTARWVVDGGGSGPLELLVVEAGGGHVRPPRRYLSPTGQFLEQAPYCERDIRSPDALEWSSDGDGGPVDVLVRHRGGLTRHSLSSSPFDVVGWDGCLYPWALSIHDFEPIVGSVHQPPHVHQTFEGRGVVVCSFVPRPYDFHPGAIKVPYHHANVDSDEVIFYSSGDFMSRAGSGIGVGSISLHPAGFVHGPQPGSMERSADQDRTEEVAVMIDTFRPLALGPAALASTDPDYPWSWSTDHR